MLVDDLKAELAQLNKAIVKIEAGAQSYTIGNRSLTRGNLSALYKERRTLRQEIASLETGGGCYVGSFTRD
ncbi:hypothetical protein [Acidaminococcus sp.]|uniref:hypothetical protein n=1 Tax=Acidaminococcus sp. TaxID=1872103 RepID=UPI003D7D7F4F